MSEAIHPNSFFHQKLKAVAFTIQSYSGSYGTKIETEEGTLYTPNEGSFSIRVNKNGDWFFEGDSSEMESLFHDGMKMAINLMFNEIISMNGRGKRVPFRSAFQGNNLTQIMVGTWIYQRDKKAKQTRIINVQERFSVENVRGKTRTRGITPEDFIQMAVKFYEASQAVSEPVPSETAIIPSEEC